MDDPVRASRNWSRAQKSTNTDNKREAERLLGQLRADLLNHRIAAVKNGTIGWAEFRRRYEDEVTTGFAKKTAEKIGTILDTLERLVSPVKLRDLTAVNQPVQGKLREQGLAESTIASYSRKATLGWAVEMGLITAVPKMNRLRRAKRCIEVDERPTDQSNRIRHHAQQGAGSGGCSSNAVNGPITWRGCGGPACV